MTNDQPKSEPDVPASAAAPNRSVTADLLTASPLPATTTGWAVAGPKIPPFVGD